MDKQEKRDPTGPSVTEPSARNSGPTGSLFAPVNPDNKVLNAQGYSVSDHLKPETGDESQKDQQFKRDNNLTLVDKKAGVVGAGGAEDRKHNLEHLPNTDPSIEKISSSDIAHDDHSSSIMDTGEGNERQPGENDDIMTTDSLDVDSNDTDSALGDVSRLSSTMSVNSELYDHVMENGRTYHRYKEGKYALPNDETEQNRLDIQHQLFVLTLNGKLHLAPLSEGTQNVLDIATGTGIWAIDFAVKYPSASVLGMDLSPIQPKFIPPNCRFEIDDAEDDWTYNESFDYIHGRLLLSCFNSDFPSIIRKAYDALNPGGWFELQDMLPPRGFDSTLEGTDLGRWLDLTLEGARRLGMDWHKVGRYKEWVKEAGFEDVREFKSAWPTNTWPRDRHHKLLGAWQNANMMEGLHGISVAVLTRGMGMTAQEVEVLLIGVRRDLCDRNIHCYAPVRVIYGRKPGGRESGTAAGPKSGLI